MSEARGFHTGNFYLSYWPSSHPFKHLPKRNVNIHKECKKIRNVVSSAAEAKMCGEFNDVKTSIHIQPALITLYHRQP